MFFFFKQNLKLTCYLNILQSRKKQVYVERVGQLQRALSSLQASSDRREETERQLRGQLERELREGGNTGKNGEHSSTGETIADLRRRMRERDEKIMTLEGDVTKWEQRYLEESALRQAAIDAASLPKYVFFLLYQFFF